MAVPGNSGELFTAIWQRRADEQETFKVRLNWLQMACS
jgi:hypothetical protein